MKTRYASCPECGKMLTLTKDGRFRKHKGLWPITVREQPICPASGREAT